MPWSWRKRYGPPELETAGFIAVDSPPMEIGFILMQFQKSEAMAGSLGAKDHDIITNMEEFFLGEYRGRLWCENWNTQQ
jgi:hypothetical protein